MSKLKSLNDSSKPKAYSRFQGESVQNVARDIAEHFFKNAEAADTAEGITDWWIARQKRSNALPVIRKALNLLVEEGLVNKRTWEPGHLLDSRRLMSLLQTIYNHKGDI